MNKESRVPRNASYDNKVTTTDANINMNNRLILPCKGEQGQKIIKSVDNHVKKLLSENHVSEHVYIVIQK